MNILQVDGLSTDTPVLGRHIITTEIPKLGKEAALKALKEWVNQCPRSPTLYSVQLQV